MGFLHSMKKKAKKIGSKTALSVGKMGITAGKAMTTTGKVVQTVGTVSDEVFGTDMGLKKGGKLVSQYGKIETALGRSTREGVRGHGRSQMNQLEKAGKKSMRFLKTARKFR